MDETTDSVVPVYFFMIMTARLQIIPFHIYAYIIMYRLTSRQPHSLKHSVTVMIAAMLYLVSSEMTLNLPGKFLCTMVGIGNRMDSRAISWRKLHKQLVHVLQ